MLYQGLRSRLDTRCSTPLVAGFLTCEASFDYSRKVQSVLTLVQHLRQSTRWAAAFLVCATGAQLCKIALTAPVVYEGVLYMHTVLAGRVLYLCKRCVQLILHHTNLAKPTHSRTSRVEMRCRYSLAALASMRHITVPSGERSWRAERYVEVLQSCHNYVAHLASDTAGQPGAVVLVDRRTIST
jgi:hypothetical protein